MSKRKHTFGLKTYPHINYQFDAYLNNMGRNFIDELNPVLKWVSRETVAEGESETIERLDGSRVTMNFDEVSVSIPLTPNVIIYGNFDEVIAFIYDIANEMGNKMTRKMLNTIYVAAEEYGNVHHNEELNIETMCQILERTDLTFNDEGIMDQQFVIPPQLVDKFKHITSDPTVQDIIARKRRQYFAKKNN